MKIIRLTSIYILVSFGCILALEQPNDACADVRDVARLETLTPNTPIVSRGQTLRIAVKIGLVSYPQEPIESTALLTVNGQSFRPYYTIITPGEIKLSQEFSWFTVPRGSSLTIRFRLIVIGSLSKSGYEAVDITRDFKVVRPHVRLKTPSHKGIYRSSKSKFQKRHLPAACPANTYSHPSLHADCVGFEKQGTITSSLSSS